MDSNASFGVEVERNVSRDNDFSLRGKLHQGAVSTGASRYTD